MTWNADYLDLLKRKRVLVVGAGGIGCELLKNLVLTGFVNLHVVDLDTIDVSNLNRQFLFRREHVGKSKAEVATAAVRALRKDTNIVFDHGSIMDSKFGLSFFQGFDFVMNALDNKAARTHVNRMCLAGNIPLIESGSAGYLGQVTNIIKGKSECFECVEKPSQQKTFPGCTIRNTPSEHIHCTVWAKHLFNQLFGEIDIDDDVSPDVNDEENKIPESLQSDDEQKGNVTDDDDNKDERQNTREWAEEVKYDPALLFKKLFHDDIEYLLLMENLWKQRRKPTPLTLEDVQNMGCSSSQNSSVEADIKQVWTASQCAQAFVDCVIALRERKEQLPEGQILAWDKDDDEAMKFVVACGNIRALIFGIPMKTAFEIKSMAGNIIPAIATTNAMVAGMMVVEALKIANNKIDDLRAVFIATSANPRGKVLVDEELKNPNPNCFTCSEKHECFVRVNLMEMTMKAFREKVLIGALNFQSPDVEEKGRIIIDSEMDERDEVNVRRFTDLKISDGACLVCEDFLTDLKISIYLQCSDKLKGDDFEIVKSSGVKAEEMDVSLAERKRPVSELDEEPDAKRSRTVEEV